MLWDRQTALGQDVSFFNQNPRGSEAVSMCHSAFSANFGEAG